MGKMNSVMIRDFVMIREIIHDYINGQFSKKKLLHHEDFAPGRSFVSFYDDFEQT